MNARASVRSRSRRRPSRRLLRSTPAVGHLAVLVTEHLPAYENIRLLCSAAGWPLRTRTDWEVERAPSTSRLARQGMNIIMISVNRLMLFQTESPSSSLPAAAFATHTHPPPAVTSTCRFDFYWTPIHVALVLPVVLRSPSFTSCSSCSSPPCRVLGRFHTRANTNLKFHFYLFIRQSSSITSITASQPGDE